MKEETSRIGVDFDGVLVKWGPFTQDSYDPSNVSEPVPEMVARVKRWLDQGKEVVIFTARAHPSHKENELLAREAIKKWCMEQFGRELEITCMKDPQMTEIWDDRAVTVEKDTGRILTQGYIEEVGEIPDSIGSLV